ncbi:helix-turn-helix transcriptional regulator [Liquorilactobacillus satsumensis]|uniref:helix-turn-helix transcriptional regulator n=1 Tax=Liquorilactobacillus satsumensis TaxID=259059 RepID=UPI00345DCC82
MQYKLLALRKEKNETQKDVAEMLGITEASYRNKENGKTQFKMNEMFCLASHYCHSIEEIFLPRKFTISEQKEKVRK